MKHLCDIFGVETQEMVSVPASVGQLSEVDLDHARNTIEATLSLYYAEMEEYCKHALSVTPDHIYSGASMGRAYLKSMGITAPPLLDTSAVPFSEDQVLGFAMCAYHPGRSEPHIVNLPLPAIYVDFHGMYPAVCILQGLFDLMKAQSIQVTDATAQTVEFLEKVQAEDSFNPETWRRLNVLCLVDPQEDMLPIRADFRARRPQGSSVSYRASLALIESAREPIWWPLADCLESKRRTGKPPKILLALAFNAKGTKALNPISIRGQLVIDPNQEDFFHALVEARDNLGGADHGLAEALKIAVNATSYGIWAEVDIEEGERAVMAFATNERQAVIPHGEKPGSFYAPIFASLITAGARHMLGLLEGEIEKLGGVTAFCDTDSLGVVASKQGGTISFLDHNNKKQELPVLPWTRLDEALHKFDRLNPYRSGKPLIKLEPQNFEDEDPTKPRVNLHVKVIAAKRYGLFLPAEVKGQLPRVVKASYHTLGIVEPPRDAQGREIDDWIDQFWAHVAANLPFNPPWADQVVEFHLAISRPDVRRSFRRILQANSIDTGNKWMNPYLSRVKPFSTLAVLSKSRRIEENVDQSDELKDVSVIAAVARSGQSTSQRWVGKDSGRLVYLMLPDKTMDLNERKAVRESIERGGWLVTTPMTFREFMDEYVHHHETKGLDSYGRPIDRETRGPLSYPQVRITDILFIGKETVLQEEMDRGLMTEQQVAADRVMIGTNGEPVAKLVIEVLRLLTRSERKRLAIGRRASDKISNDYDNPSLKDKLAQAQMVERIAKYLQENHPDEVGTATDEDALHAFLANRNRILEHWETIKPRLKELPTKELMKISGCSRGTARNIKYQRTEPRIETIKKLVRAFGNK